MTNLTRSLKGAHLRGMKRRASARDMSAVEQEALTFLATLAAELGPDVAAWPERARADRLAALTWLGNPDHVIVDVVWASVHARIDLGLAGAVLGAGE